MELKTELSNINWLFCLLVQNLKINIHLFISNKILSNFEAFNLLIIEAPHNNKIFESLGMRSKDKKSQKVCVFF